jgi:hypothetical protein
VSYVVGLRVVQALKVQFGLEASNGTPGTATCIYASSYFGHVKLNAPRVT